MMSGFLVVKCLQSAFDVTSPRTCMGPLKVMMVKHVIPNIMIVDFTTITYSECYMEYINFGIVFYFLFLYQSFYNLKDSMADEFL